MVLENSDLLEIFDQKSLEESLGCFLAGPSEVPAHQQQLPLLWDPPNPESSPSPGGSDIVLRVLEQVRTGHEEAGVSGVAQVRLRGVRLVTEGKPSYIVSTSQYLLALEQLRSSAPPEPRCR